MNQWIDVSKERPPMEKPVLAVAQKYGGRGYWLCAALRRAYEYEEDWTWAVSNGALNDPSHFDDEGEYNITHWMPLPELPKRSEA
jgi:hypothetical protein